MAQKTEHCENCGKVLGKLEQAYVYEGRVVCKQCNDALRHPVYVTQTKSVSGLGIAALVLGLVACLGCWIPMCGIFSLPFAMLGALFGVIGIIIAKLKKKSYVGLPIAGTIVSVTAAFIVIAVTGSIASSIEESSRTIGEGLHRTRDTMDFGVDDSGSSAGSSVSSSSSKSSVPVQVYNTGETVHVGYTSYCVWRSWWSKRLSDNKFFDDRPDAMFLFVELTVRNDDKKARSIPPFELVDENGAEYEASSKAWAVDGSIGVLESLNPSVQKKGFIVFDVPTNHEYRLKVSGGYWSAEDAFIALEPN